MLDESVMATMQCTLCGEEFGCGARQGKCWCMDFPPLPMPVDGDAACWCPACLEKATKTERNVSPASE